MATWTKIEDDGWGVRVENGDHVVHMIGMPVVVTSKAGKKTTVVLGEHVKAFRIKGGTRVDIYKVAREDS